MITAPFDSQAYQLMKAVMAGDAAAVDAELAKKPNLDWPDSNGMTSMHHAAKINSPAIIRKLAAAGASVHMQDNLQRTPLGVAAEGGFVDAAKEILAAGASPATDKEENALSLAAEGGHHGMAKLLLAAKFPVDFMPTASPSPLMIAAQRNDVPMLEIFVAAKADPNLRDMRNSTALHRTTWNNSYEAARYLLDHGADETLTNIDGATPETYAVHKGYEGLAGLFAQAPEVRRVAEEKRQAAIQAEIDRNNNALRTVMKHLGEGMGRAVEAPRKAQFKPKSKAM